MVAPYHFAVVGIDGVDPATRITDPGPATAHQIAARCRFRGARFADENRAVVERANHEAVQFRVVGGTIPFDPAGRPRARLDPLRGRGDDGFIDRRDGGFRHEFVRAPIDDVQVAVLASRRHALFVVAVAVEHGRGGEIVIEAVVWRELIPPLEFATQGIEYEHRVRVEVVAGTFGRHEIGDRVGDRNEHFSG